MYQIEEEKWYEILGLLSACRLAFYAAWHGDLHQEDADRMMALINGFTSSYKPNFVNPTE